MTIPANPYYSIDPSNSDRHHIFADCPNGMQIRPQHRRNGTNESPLVEAAKTYRASLPVMTNRKRCPQIRYP